MKTWWFLVGVIIIVIYYLYRKRADEGFLNFAVYSITVTEGTLIGLDSKMKETITFPIGDYNKSVFSNVIYLKGPGTFTAKGLYGSNLFTITLKPNEILIPSKDIFGKDNRYIRNAKIDRFSLIKASSSSSEYILHDGKYFKEIKFGDKKIYDVKYIKGIILRPGDKLILYVYKGKNINMEFVGGDTAYIFYFTKR